MSCQKKEQKTNGLVEEGEVEKHQRGRKEGKKHHNGWGRKGKGEKKDLKHGNFQGPAIIKRPKRRSCLFFGVGVGGEMGMRREGKKSV